MSLKKIILTDKFNDDNSYVFIRWISGESTYNNKKIQKHSWSKQNIHYLLNFLLDTYKLCLNNCRLENYYQDSENVWWISNDGTNGGYKIVDQISYMVNNSQQNCAAVSVHLQKRKTDSNPIKIPTIQTLSRFYNTSRYHFIIYVTEKIVLHITTGTVDREDNYQLWMEFPVKMEEDNYEKVEDLYKTVYTVLMESKHLKDNIINKNI